METIINQIFEISQKSEKNTEVNLSRNIKRIYSELEEMGYQIINPMGRPYRETDSDIEANIAGGVSRKSKIEKVLKPIIYKNENGSNVLVQKGIVIVG
jgi:hypothetical protein